MTTYAVHQTSNGQLVSVGTVVANPLPAGLAALALSAGDAQALRDGTGAWDAGALVVLMLPPDPTIANRSAIETNLATDMDAMQALIDATNATINANPATHLKNVARMLRRSGRLHLNDLDGTT